MPQVLAARSRRPGDDRVGPRTALRSRHPLLRGDDLDLIADFGNQERWLGKSSAFRGTHEISSDPVALGTTYREPGPLVVRNGTVTEFKPPTRLTSHQPMTGRLRTVRRTVTIEIPRSLALVRPVVVRAFAHESRRTRLALKAYADTVA